MDGKKTVRVDGLSKLTKIEELRQRLVEDFDVEPERQRLFVKGKQVRLLQIWSLIQSQLSWLDDCTQVSVHGLILASVAHVTLEDLDWGGGGSTGMSGSQQDEHKFISWIWVTRP